VRDDMRRRRVRNGGLAPPRAGRRRGARSRRARFHTGRAIRPAAAAGEGDHRGGSAQGEGSRTSHFRSGSRSSTSLGHALAARCSRAVTARGKGSARIARESSCGMEVRFIADDSSRPVEAIAKQSVSCLSGAGETPLNSPAPSGNEQAACPHALGRSNLARHDTRAHRARSKFSPARRERQLDRDV
jgi:hypothetical protein